MQELTKLKNLFPVQKTLSFALLPVGNTLKTIQKAGFIEDAEKEAQHRPLVTAAIDTFHRNALAGVLTSDSLRFPENDLWARVIDAYRKRKEGDEGKARWDAAYHEVAQAFMDAMSKHPLFELATAATPSRMIKEKILPAVEQGDPKTFDAVLYYTTRASLLQDYQVIRSKMYESTKKGTPAYRAINENMPRFEANIRNWKVVLEKLPGAREAFDAVTAGLDLRGIPVEAFFDEASYGRFLSETHIAVYNALLNGWTDSETRHKGLRAYIHEAIQKDKTLKLPDLQKLHHQILSERETLSYVPAKATKDDDVWDAIASFFDGFHQADAAHVAYGVLEGLSGGVYDTSLVSIAARDVSFLSNQILGNWRSGKEALRDLAAQRWPKNKGKRDSFLKKERYSLDDLDAAFALCGYDGGIAAKLLADFERDAPLAGVAESEVRNLRDMKVSLSVGKEGNSMLASALQEAKKGYEVISILRCKDDKQSDPALLEDLEDVFAAWGAIIPVMNLARSWCTRKPYSDEKIRLSLGNTQLMGGWSWGKDGKNVNTKAAAFAWIDGQLHLLIRRLTARSSDRPKDDSDGKFDYTALTRGEGGVTLVVQDKLDCAKAFPKMLTGKESAKYITVPEEDIEAIRRGDHKVSKEHPVADMALVERMIGWMQELWDSHPSFKTIHFTKHAPAMYNSWNEFIEECDEHSYLMTTKEVSRKQIDDAVADGSLLCFRVYSKDLERMYKGYTVKYLPAIHLVDAVRGEHDTELCGFAAMYFRKKSIEKPVVHKKGTFVVNKRANDERRTPIPEKVWKEIYLFKNGRLERSKLSAEVVSWLESGKVVAKQVERDIVKDYSFTVDRFLLHVPVTMQRSCDPGTKDIEGLVNLRVDEAIKNGAGRNIIGINRGENNLLYVVVIGPDGRVLEQRSLNVIDGVDYAGRINDRVGTMREQQRRWEDMDRVTPIKDGYVANALPEIYRLILKYDALVAMEDLDMSFTSSRAQLGQTVYRKFENMLLDKLAYLVPDVVNAPHEALQLSPGSKATDKRGGVVYFVSPFATSGLDPKTGWLNLLPVYGADSAEKKRALFEKMDSVTRDKYGDWHFSFDYANYGIERAGIKTAWTVTSKGERLERTTDENGKDSVERVEISRLFDEAVGGDYEGDLKEKLASLRGTSLDTAVRALRLMLQTRNCLIGDVSGRYISPVEGAVKGFDSDNARDDEPLCTDAVTAFNLARKLRFLLQVQAQGEDIEILDGGRWLTMAQNFPLR